MNQAPTLSDLTAAQLVDPANFCTVGPRFIQTKYGWFAVNDDGTIDAPADAIEALAKEIADDTMADGIYPTGDAIHTGAS